MRFSDLVVTSCTVLALLAGPVTSAADPIPVEITAGSLNMSGSFGVLSPVGDHGFTFVGSVNTSEGIFGPSSACDPCLPGDPISLGALWNGKDLTGTATFEGTTYTQVGSLMSGHAQGSVSFTGSTVAPPLEGLTATLIAPFLFQGTFSFPPSGTTAAALASLMGGGTATLVLHRQNLDVSNWSYMSAVYEFEPVPEPGTLILVGTALAGLAFRRRQRANR